MPLFVVNAGLLFVVAVSIVGTSILDRPAVNVEGSVRRYAAAVTAQDLDAALEEMAPDQRGAWRDWIATQLGNVYEVRGIAVRSQPPLGRQPFEVTVVLDVNRGYPDEYYQPTTTEPLKQVDGVWYLARPLLSR